MSDGMTDTLKKFANSTGEVMKVPALKGQLGGVEYYVIMLSFGKLARYIEVTDPNLPPQQRENRRARPERYAEIAEYILKYPENYRFSALTCTYGKNGTKTPVDWRPADLEAAPGTPGWMIGELTLNQDDPLIIVDGQHRLGAIKEAVEKEPELRKESIAIVLFPYIDIEESQQIFSDLNRTAKKTSKSLDVFFNRRDVVNRVVQKVVTQVSVFQDWVDIENISVSKSQSKIFTLAGVFQATDPMINGAYKGGLLPEELVAANEDEYLGFLSDAWEFIAAQFPEWGKVACGEINISQQRQSYLHWNSGVLSSIGEFVGVVMREKGEGWKEIVKMALTHPDNGEWRRDAKYWGGIILAGDQVLPRSAVRIQLIAYLKLKASLPLTEGETESLANLAPGIQKRIGFSR